MSRTSHPHDRPKHEGREVDQARPGTTEQAIRAAHVILASAGAIVSPSKVTRLARDYVRARPPVDFSEYLLRNASTAGPRSMPPPRNRHGVEWQDPTGNTAADNVDAGSSSKQESRPSQGTGSLTAQTTS